MEGEQIVTLWCALDHVTAETGAVEYAPTRQHGCLLPAFRVHNRPIVRGRYVAGSHRWGQQFRAVSFNPEEAYETELPPVPEIEGRREDYEILQFELQPGDLILCAANLLCGLQPRTDGTPGRLLCAEFAASGWLPTFSALESPDPAWKSALGATERLLLDGGGDEDGQAPPAGLAGDPEEAAERWAWDLCGYLVLPGIMDEEWQQQCLASIDANSELVVDRTHHRTFPRDHEGDSSAGSRALVELLALPEPHSSPFARSESSNGCPSHLTTRSPDAAPCCQQ